jgi:hypothetical protein
MKSQTLLKDLETKNADNKQAANQSGSIPAMQRGESPHSNTSRDSGARALKSRRSDETPSAAASSEARTGKPISPQKMAANLEKSQRSTGPKTETGKRYSRQNALKHGILASALLITEGRYHEDEEEFRLLLHNLRQGWKPVGELEEMLVEEIAVCTWRQRRSLQCERGLIQRQIVIETADPAPDVQALRLALGREESDEMVQQLNAITDHFSIPLGLGLAQILRYQASNRRQKADAIAELERLQYRRSGGLATPRQEV